MIRNKIFAMLSCLATTYVFGAACMSSPPMSEVSAPARSAAAAPAQAWTWTVEPGKLAEVNVELSAGAKMSATFSAGQTELAWNVHSHPGDKPLIHSEGRAKQGSAEHTAVAAGVYSFLWENDGKTPVELTVEVRIDGEGKVHSTHP